MPDIFLESPRFPGCPSAGLYQRSAVPRGDHPPCEWRGKAQPALELSADPIDCDDRAAREDEIQEVLEFYHSVGGQAVAFRVKDYSDYKSCDVSFDPTALDQPLLATAVGGTYQLTKLYQFGVDQDGNPVTQYRPIYKPVAGTVLLSGAGSVDYETGLVTGSGGGTWGGEFDVPCRFDSGFPWKSWHARSNRSPSR